MDDDKFEKLQQIKNTEKIFMIELLIQKVFLDVIELTDLNFRNAETCVSYKFLEYGPFEICEKDFKCYAEDGGCAGCNILKNGNSTMFPLFPDQITDIKVNGFEINLSILKKFKAGPKVVGTTIIQMKDIFSACIDFMVRKTVEIVSKSMKNRYKLQSEEGDPVGHIDLFIRISSMGKMIVTKFQMDTTKECMEFQSSAGNTYKYKKEIFPDPYLCKPCGKSTKMFPPYEKTAELPKDFPAFKVTPDMKARLQSRRYKELGIAEPAATPKATGKKGPNAAKKDSKGGKNTPSKIETVRRESNKKNKDEEPAAEPEEAAE